MLFDGTLNVINIELGIPEGQDHIEVGLLIGLPVPAGQNQLALLPAAKLRYMIQTKEQAKDFSEELGKLAEQLPAAPNLEVASNMSEVEAAAKRMEDLRKGQG